MKSVFKKYYEPTPPRLRRLGDTILIGCTSLTPIIMGSPFSDNAKAWSVTVISILGVIGKVITNFFTDESTKSIQPE